MVGDRPRSLQVEMNASYWKELHPDYNNLHHALLHELAGWIREELVSVTAEEMLGVLIDKTKLHKQSDSSPQWFGL